MNKLTGEDIAEFRRRALTAPLYTSGGEISDLPEAMANAIDELQEALGNARLHLLEATLFRGYAGGPLSEPSVKKCLLDAGELL